MSRDQKYVARARVMYASDDIEIDDNPMVSEDHPGINGKWVAAWLWVSDDEIEEEE